MQQHGRRYLGREPLPPPLTLGVKRSKLNFYRILSYQTEYILEFRNMAANILPTYLLPTPLELGYGVKGQKVKIQLIENMVTLHMKSNRIEKAATCKYFGGKSPPPAPLNLWSKVNLFRTWSCCISNLRESQMKQRCSKYFTRRPRPHGHVAYQIKGNGA